MDAPEHAVYVVLYDGTDGVFEAFSVAFGSGVRADVGDGGDEPTEEGEEVVDGVAGELPVLHGLDCEAGGEGEPLGVAGGFDELAELVVGLQAA